MKRYSSILVIALVGSLPAKASAQDADVENYYEHATKTIVADKNAEASLGEVISLYDGSVAFHQEDARLSGTGPDIVISRRTEIGKRLETQALRGDFGDWYLGIPHLQTLAADTDRNVGRREWVVEKEGRPLRYHRCSNFQSPPGTDEESARLWWSGVRLHDGKSSSEFVLKRTATSALPLPQLTTPGALNTFPLLTRSGWAIDCLTQTSNGEAGEAFLAISPDGTKHFFDHIRYKESYVRSGVGVSTAYAFPTWIEDKFGNYVAYTYGEFGPTRIESSDGRVVTIRWDAQTPLISSITLYPGSSKQRILTYTYRTDRTLHQVVLPDLSRWSFDASDVRLRTSERNPTDLGGNGRRCVIENPSALPNELTNPRILTMTSPTGLTAQYTIEPKRHGLNASRNQCDTKGYYTNTALIKKVYMGPGIQAQWTYTYPFARTFKSNCGAGCPVKKYVYAQNPDGSSHEYVYNNTDKGFLEGRLLEVHHTDVGGVRRSVVYTLPSDSLGLGVSQHGDFHYGEGMIGVSVNVQRESSVIPILSTELQIDSQSFYVNNTQFDSLSRPLTTQRWNNHSNSVIAETQQYFDSVSKWVFGLPHRKTVNGVEIAKTDYDALAMPWKTYNYGALSQTLSYNYAAAPESGQRGTLSAATNAKSQTTTFTNWKRGVPGSIIYPSTPDSPGGASQIAEIGDDGTIDSIMDEVGNRTCFNYDAAGRINKITYPSDSTLGSCSQDKWNPTNISLVQSASPAFGLPAGHWQQTVTNGNSVTRVYLDGLWRPVIKETYDDENTRTRTDSMRRLVHRYDGVGNQIFESYPVASISSYQDPSIPGNRYSYDSFGRVKQRTSNWEGPGTISESTEYLSGLRTRVIDARGKVTTTHYLAWDTPTSAYPLLIEEPESRYTHFVRDAIGRIERIQRSTSAGLGATASLDRLYSYHADGRICRADDAEAGSSVFAYDQAGNVTSSASGLSLPRNNQCYLQTGLEAGRTATRQYDARGRLLSISFPDGRGNTNWTYTPDGRVASASSRQFLGGDPIVSTYAYDSRRNVVLESQSAPGATWNLQHSYDANSNRTQTTYPSGYAVGYQPDAMGAPRAVGSLVSGVKYSPFGTVREFSYGNGVRHSATFNVRGLISNACDYSGSCNGSAVLNEWYDYDQARNAVSITDGRVGSLTTRSMTYDDADRLTSVASADFGQATYSYDAYDNLTRTIVTGGSMARDYSYCYGTSGRLTNVKSGGCDGASLVGFGYDSQGNVVSKNAINYLFDQANRLRGISTGRSYTYDARGLRVHETIGTANPRTTRYMYDLEGNLIYKESSSSAVEYFYLGKRSVATRSRPFGIPNAQILVTYLHTDPQGSHIASTGSSATEGTRSVYEPFGQVINRSMTGGIGYTGHIEDDSGLIYMQQRYYDPLVGRFFSVDPITLASGGVDHFSRYNYAYGNPFKFVDPDGRCGMQGFSDLCGKSLETIQAQEEAKFRSKPTLFGRVFRTMLDFSPVIGDRIAVGEAVRKPTLVNISAAGIGFFGPAGDLAGKALKRGDSLSDIVRVAIPPDRSSLGTDEALSRAVDFLGDGYRKIADGIFRSADGTRQVRFTDRDLAPTNNHAGAPHMNFEEGREVTNPQGRVSFKDDKNHHVYLPEERIDD